VGFVLIKQQVFAKTCEPMLAAAQFYRDKTRELGLSKLECILIYMCKCVNKEEGTENKILYIQYYRVLNIELQETKKALKEFFDANKKKKAAKAAEEEKALVVPERKDDE
jgi:hypothetical protein